MVNAHYQGANKKSELDFVILFFQYCQLAAYIQIIAICTIAAY